MTSDKYQLTNGKLDSPSISRSTDRTSSLSPGRTLQFIDSFANLRCESVDFRLCSASGAEGIADLIITQLAQYAVKPGDVVSGYRTKRAHFTGVVEIDRIASRSTEELLPGIIGQIPFGVRHKTAGLSERPAPIGNQVPVLYTAVLVIHTENVIIGRLGVPVAEQTVEDGKAGELFRSDERIAAPVPIDRAACDIVRALLGHGVRE